MSELNKMGLLDLLDRLARGIVAVAGPHCEVVVHDFSDLEHSAVVVAGNVSGRAPGAPVPDLDFISEELSAGTPDQFNYRVKIDGREMQSSTVWIRDDAGVPVGAVCINVEYSQLLDAYQLLERMTKPARETPDLVVQDTWAKDSDELIDRSVTTFLRQEGMEGIRDLDKNGKLRLIHFLEERRLFRLRGSAQHIADLLQVSRASIYNYRARYKKSKTVETNSEG
jgi:predicted transcriptional regulator YheO